MKSCRQFLLRHVKLYFVSLIIFSVDFSLSEKASQLTVLQIHLENSDCGFFSALKLSFIDGK